MGEEEAKKREKEKTGGVGGGRMRKKLPEGVKLFFAKKGQSISGREKKTFGHMGMKADSSQQKVWRSGHIYVGWGKNCFRTGGGREPERKG